MHLHDIIRLDDHYKAAVLIRADGDIGNEQRLVSTAAGDAHAGEHAGLEKSIGIGEYAAPAHGPRARLQPVVHEINHTLMRKPLFAGDSHEGWNLSIAGTDALPLARQ